MFAKLIAIMAYKKTKILILGVLIVLLYSTAMAMVPEKFFTSPDFFEQGLKLVKDNSDITYFYNRSSWIAEHKIPYKDAAEEYPQVAVLFLVIPRLFTNNPIVYQIILQFLLGICFILLLWTTICILQELNKNLNYALLFFLPSVLYFSFNRFDVLPALFVQFSFYLLLKKQHNWSLFLLGLAALTKWYAGLFILPYLIYFIQQAQDKEGIKMGLKAIGVFIATILFFNFVTLITAGFNGILSPYFWHLNRSIEVGSFLSSLTSIFSWQSFGSSNSAISSVFNQLSQLLFVILQFIAIRWVIETKIKNPKDIILLMLLLLLPFILFMRIYSN